MSVTARKKQDIYPEETGGMRVLVIAIIAIALAALVAWAIWFFAIRDTAPTIEATPSPFQTEISEITSRGFSDVTPVSTFSVASSPAAEEGPPVAEEREEIKRFYAYLNSCRVRIHVDEKGLLVLILKEYRIVDPDDDFLRSDPVFGVCFENEASSIPTAHPDPFG